jgi:hypothetical protein
VTARNRQSVDGSAFSDASIASILIESGNEIFGFENEFFIDIIHDTLIRKFSTSSNIEIGSDIVILGSFYFPSCESLSSISIESPSQLIRIKSQTFRGLDVLVVIPSTVIFITCFAFRNVSQI